MRWFILFLFFALLQAETSLGGIALGDKFENVQKKYPQYKSWSDLEQTSLPYPLSLTSQQQVFLAQSPNLDLQCYFDEKKEVVAISVFLNTGRLKDPNTYETSAGLRPGDGLVELKLLYGTPQEISEYIYKDASGKRISRKIYYYQDLCIQTRQQENLPEFIDLILVGKYDLKAALAKKNIPLIRNY